MSSDVNEETEHDERPSIEKILVPIDFSPSSDAALDYALSVAGETGAEVQVLHVWSPTAPDTPPTIFAETPQGAAMERRLSAAESAHAVRVSGRLEFGEEPSHVILSILERERFDLVVMGSEGDGADRAPSAPCGHVASCVAHGAKCTVVTLPRGPRAA